MDHLTAEGIPGDSSESKHQDESSDRTSSHHHRHSDVEVGLAHRKNETIPILDHSNSMLSEDEEEEIVEVQQAPYMERASVEVIQNHPDKAMRFQSAGNGSMVEDGESSFAHLDITNSTDGDDVLFMSSERDVFRTIQEEGGAPLLPTNEPDDTTPRIQNKRMARTPSIKSSVPAWDVLHSLEILPAANVGVVPSDAVTLSSVIEQFSSPSVDLETCEKLVYMEKTESYEMQVELPEQPMICIHHESRVVAILRHPTALVQLPEVFTRALLRLVARLLSQESDEDYNHACYYLPPKVTRVDIDTIPQPTDNPDLPYSIARFQCTWMSYEKASAQSINQDSRLAVQTLLELHDRCNNVRLKPPLSRLLALTTSAGISPGLLRKRTLLQYPAHPKPKLSHIFCFGTDSHLQRTLSGLSQWPFRNDFGMASWFRAERFSSQPVRLLQIDSLLTKIEISLEPVADHEACMVVVRVGDAVVNGGFVVLPRVWYHLAVRHTRARLKGVFSLTTREQISIFLDGKPMLTEPFPFPKIEDEKLTASINLTVRFCENFEGQTGALYLFHDNVSDASLRALHELGAGYRGTTKQSTSPDTTWDARRGDLVRKSRVLDASITKDDADEIVLSQRRPSSMRKRMFSSKFASVVDLLDDDENDDSEVLAELRRSAFGSKLFLVWDPRRTVGSFSLELHLGAHVEMIGVYAWSFNGVQDVIGSIGGIQALVPTFRSVLSMDATIGDKERNRLLYRRCLTLPSLFRLLSSYVREHSDNARELLRCGAIDVIEQLLLSSRKGGTNKPKEASVFGLLNSSVNLSRILAVSLLDLRAACAHYVGLETKVYTRLLFNFPLWVGNLYQPPGSSGPAMALVFLPVLASLMKQNPEKARDCIGVGEIVLALKNCLALETDGSRNRFKEEISDQIDRESQPLTIAERTYCGNMLLGMIFCVLSAGASARDLSSFIHFLASCLDDSDSVLGPNILTRSSAMVLLFLLQLRPAVPSLCDSLAEVCGSVHAVASWILSSMINSVHDEIRSIGVRCLGAYLDQTSRGMDSMLVIQTPLQPTRSSTDLAKSSARLSSIAKGIATIGPSVRNPLHPSKMTTRVIFKVCEHLLWNYTKILIAVVAST